MIHFLQRLYHGISEISDVLADRTIKYRTKKIKSTVSVEEFAITDELNNQFSKIVNDLYLFGLCYANKVYEIYNSGEIKKIDKLSVRENDIWKPLLTIASIIDKEGNMNVTEQLKEYAILLNEEKRRINLENNMSYKLIRMLDEFLATGVKPSDVKDKNIVGYNIHKVFEFAKETGEFEEVKAVQNLSKLLNDNLDIKSKRVYDSFGYRVRLYLFDKDLVNDLKDRYNLETEEN